MNYDRYDQRALDRIESILEHLNVEFTVNSNYIKFKCPIHDSEKITSGTIYLDTGIWQCHSDDCSEKHGNRLTKFVDAVLKKSDPNSTMFDAACFIDKQHKIKTRPIAESRPMNFLSESNHPEIILPSRYYIDRGISRETLMTFNVGDGVSGVWKNKAIVPIYYSGGQYMGFTARSHFAECEKCKYHHDKYENCIDISDDFAMMYKRWIHKKGTQVSKTFYGIHKAAGNKAIIVEGISCVWRLWEHQMIGLGCCGTAFGKSKADLLHNLGITKLIIAADQDEAGQKFANKIIQKYYREFSVFPVKLPAKDVSDMTDEQIDSIIKPMWNKI
jgi:5S rRNA maturation endonuclease (ribonuclease M5)